MRSWADWIRMHSAGLSASINQHDENAPHVLSTYSACLVLHRSMRPLCFIPFKIPSQKTFGKKKIDPFSTKPLTWETNIHTNIQKALRQRALPAAPERCPHPGPDRREPLAPRGGAPTARLPGRCPRGRQRRVGTPVGGKLLNSLVRDLVRDLVS